MTFCPNCQSESLWLVRSLEFLSRYNIIISGIQKEKKNEIEQFVCLIALNSGTTGSYWKNLFVLDSSFSEEGYILFFS